MSFYSKGGTTSTQGTNSPPVWADPLGPSSLGKGGVAQYGTSGAPQMRDSLFDYMKGMNPQLQSAAQSVASGANAGVNDPAYKTAQSNARQTIAGNYLEGSPQLNRAIAADTSRTIAGAADADARIKSEMAKSGMGFSTGAQQASEANKTAAATEAGRTSAGAYLQNYLAERQNQAAGSGQLQAAQSAPLQYLSQASSAAMAPSTAQGQLLQALSGGGQTITPKVDEWTHPSQFASFLNGMGGLTSGIGSL